MKAEARKPRWAMAVDTRTCVGCAACVIACKTENDLPEGYARNWIWTGTTSPEAFGNPLLQQIDLVLCTYDGDTLVSEAPIPAIGACGPVPCWKDRSSQLTYRDRDRIPAGVEQIGVRKGKLKIKASGRSLPLPPMPAALPLTVQLQASTGVCLGADYGPVDVRANDARTLRGKGH